HCTRSLRPHGHAPWFSNICSCVAFLGDRRRRGGLVATPVRSPLVTATRLTSQRPPLQNQPQTANRPPAFTHAATSGRPLTFLSRSDRWSSVEQWSNNNSRRTG